MARIKKAIIEAAVENAKEIEVVPFPDDAMNPPEVEDIPVKEEVVEEAKPVFVAPKKTWTEVEVKPIIENEYIEM